MAKQCTIKLLDPVIGHGGKVTEVVLREPTADEFFELGEPRTQVFTVDPMSYGRKTGPVVHETKQVDNGAVIKKYLERCAVNPEFLILANASLRDAMRIKEEFLLFFDSALVAASPTPATSSSSSSNSADQPRSES